MDGGAWREEWTEKMYVEATSLELHIERGAHKWAHDAVRMRARAAAAEAGEAGRWGRGERDRGERARWAAAAPLKGGRQKR